MHRELLPNIVTSPQPLHCPPLLDLTPRRLHVTLMQMPFEATHSDLQV
jgi:hypothetical protein